MPYIYTPLWNTLNKFGIGKHELCQQLGLSSSTMAKMTNNKKVSLDVLAKICDFFACGLEDVVVYQSEMDLFMTKLHGKIIESSYTIYAQSFPEYRFLLSDMQMERMHGIDDAVIQSQLRTSEQTAINQHPAHVPIIGTTTFAVQSSRNLLVLQGSLTVVELFMEWLLEQID